MHIVFVLVRTLAGDTDQSIKYRWPKHSSKINKNQLILRKLSNQSNKMNRSLMVAPKEGTVTRANFKGAQGQENRYSGDSKAWQLLSLG